MHCSLCSTEPTQFDLTRGKPIPTKHPEDVIGTVCSRCVQRLISAPQEKIRAAHQLALETQRIDKAKALETLIEAEKEDGVNKRYVAKRAHRARPLRTVRNDQGSGWKFKKAKAPTLYQINGAQ